MALKMDDIRNLGVDELQEKLNGLKKELMQYRFQSKTGKLERQNLKQQTRKDIARIKTVMTEKKAEAKS